MKNFFRIDEDSAAIFQLFLGEIDVSFIVASLAGVRKHPNYDPSMSWLIDLSEYRSKVRLGIDARLDEIVRRGIGFHLGKSAIVIDRPYEASIRHRERIRHFESGIGFFVTKTEALSFLNLGAAESAQS